MPVSNIGQYMTAFSITSVAQFFPEVWSILLIIAVVIALFILIIGAIQWIMAGDDNEKLASARGKIMGAIIGLIIVLLAWVISGILMGAFHFPTVFQIPGSGGPGPGPEPAECTCENPNKCDINNGCNKACCAVTSDCLPPEGVGGYCSVPDGYCVSGYSCWNTPYYHLDCVGDQCVYVGSDGPGVPDACTNDLECP